MSLDPLFFYPLLAAFLMALSCSMVGVLLFVSKRLLIGETLSHAAYPGAIIAAALSLVFGMDSFLVIVCASISSFLGKCAIEWMIKSRKVHPDAALCFVLSSFFGFGVLLASYMQMKHPSSYKQALVFLFGQVATMTKTHVLIYALLGLIVILAFLLFFKELKMFSFDAGFGMGLLPRFLPHLMSFITVLAIVVSIRSVGVVLLSAMLVAPATAARSWSRSLSSMVFLALFFGTLSSFIGAYYSIRYDLPTGPVMALGAAFLALISLIIAPGRGLIARFIQRERFAWKCRTENLVKALYKKEEVEQNKVALFILRAKGLVKNGELTAKGERAALQIIRLHRLFELYLTEQVGLDKDSVHAIAEDAEHYITPDIEKEIDEELNFPEKDPHKQPIPPRGGAA
jgi:manganese/zinc/iron transport system permease protein